MNEITNPQFKKGYNERLFEGRNFRSTLHLARYLWLEKETNRYLKGKHNLSVLELGCFDGKAINFIPKPTMYVGYDANWENGLGIAREMWQGHPEYIFHQSNSVKDFNPQAKEFDASICMETLEHLPPADVEEFLAKLSAATRDFCFVSIPNEKGVVFGVKYLIKRFIMRDFSENYTVKEYLYAVLGKSHKIERREHKGFDYKKLLDTASKYFTIERKTGFGLSRFLPISLNTTVGIVLKPR